MTQDSARSSRIEADGQIARPLGGSHDKADYADRGSSFSTSSQDFQQVRVWDQRVKLAQTRGSCKLEVFGEAIPVGVVVELWAKHGPIRQLRQSVPGPLPEGLWMRRTDEPVETWEIWVRAPGVNERDGVAVFRSRRVFFTKADG